jgi:hypothetical protein
VDKRTEEGKIPKVIVDTDILIWYFRGNKDAKAFLMGIPYKERAVASLCIMELVQGCLNKAELKTVKNFIKENFSIVIHPDENIAEKAIALLEKHALSEGLRTVDALIAASALKHSASLATSNDKHFKNISHLSIINFQPSSK